MSTDVPAVEVNFDGLIGPTHNFGGLAFGNLASTYNKLQTSNPKAAALQGLDKIKLLHSLGIAQALLPPQERPCIPFLKAAGFAGNDSEVIEWAAEKSEELLQIAYSASAMWTANAATVSPSVDTEDNRLHITTANLLSQIHRAIESPQTYAFMRTLFPEEHNFVHHPPLPDDGRLYDEGAANHVRLCDHHGKRGVEVFVYGKKEGSIFAPKVFPARQSFEASKVISQTHQLNPDLIVFAQQNPAAIDGGVFHNDVISIGNENVFLYHEQAFIKTDQVIEEIREKYAKVSEKDLHLIKISAKQLSLKDAVSSYLFNSQIVTRPDGNMVFIAPAECEAGGVRDIVDMVINGNNPISEVHFVNLNESMRNGGGPACLRLRVVLSEGERGRIHPGCVITDQRIAQLEEWIQRNYREALNTADLKDPALCQEAFQALDELTKILQLGPIYSFQSG